jgi:hypothetical protein
MPLPILNHQVRLSFSFLNFFFIQLLHIFCQSSSIQCIVPSTCSNTSAEGTGVHFKMSKSHSNSENTRKHGLKSKVAINYIALECIFHASFNHVLHIHKPWGITVISHNKSELSSSSLWQDLWLISAIKKILNLNFGLERGLVWDKRGYIVTLNVCKSFYLVFQFVSALSFLSIIKLSCLLMFIATEYGITQF